MDTSRPGTRALVVSARVVITAYVVALVAVTALPAGPSVVAHAVRTVAGAVRTLGHGALVLPDGFVLAMAVTLLAVPLPGTVAGALAGHTAVVRDVAGGGRASRRVPTWDATGWSALGAVVALTAVAARSATAVSTWCSLLLAVVVGLLLGALVLGAVRTLRAPSGSPPRATGRSRRIAIAVTAFYGVGVAVVGFFGSPVDAGAAPLLTRVLGALHRVGLPPWFGYAATEFTANVVFFVPLGLLVVLLLGARWWWIGATVGFVASACIETGQALFLPARSASLDDVLSNTSGAVIGAMLGVVVLGWAERRR